MVDIEVIATSVFSSLVLQIFVLSPVLSGTVPRTNPA